MSLVANPQLAELLDKTPQAILDALPAARPPPGYTTNLVDPPWRVPEFFGVIVPFLLITLIFFGIRAYMKIFVLRKWMIEDTTLTLGFLTTITYFVIMSWATVSGPLGKHIWDITAGAAFTRGSYMSIMCGPFLPTPALGLIKATLFLQYYRLFSPRKWMKISVLIGLATTALFYTALTIAYAALWAQRPGETFVDTMFSYRWAAANNFFLPPGIVGSLLDWTLLLLPIPAVLKLKLSTYKKLGVLSIFMTGSIAAIASIVSLYYRSQMNSILVDPTWDVIPVFIWIHIELFCGIIAACMPTVHLFWNRHARLVKLSSKVKASVISAWSKSSGSPESSQDQMVVGNEKHDVKRPSPTYVGRSAVRQISNSEILVTHGYSVSSNTRSDKRDEDDRELVQSARFRDLEAQKPLPLPPFVHGRHF